MSKKRSRFQNDHFESKLKEPKCVKDEVLKSPRVNCQKKSVFTKDSIKYIYKNYHDFSSSTVDTIFENYMYPNQEIESLRHKTKRFESECDGSRNVKDHLREKLTKDAYNYEYAQYMRPYLEPNIESCHCEPIFSDAYFENLYQPQYIPHYYSYCPKEPVYPQKTVSYPKRESLEKSNLKKRAKTTKKSKRTTYLTDSSIEALQKPKSKSKSQTKIRRAVTSCGNQTDFTKKASNTATQTEENFSKGQMEKILSYCKLKRTPPETFWAIFGHYSTYIFIASLSFNLIRLYRRS